MNIFESIESKLVKAGLIFPKETKITNASELDIALDSVEVTKETVIDEATTKTITELQASFKTLEGKFETNEKLLTDYKTANDKLIQANDELVKANKTITEANEKITKENETIAKDLNEIKLAMGAQQSAGGSDPNALTVNNFGKKKELANKDIAGGRKTKAQIEEEIKAAEKAVSTTA